MSPEISRSRASASSRGRTAAYPRKSATSPSPYRIQLRGAVSAGSAKPADGAALVVVSKVEDGSLEGASADTGAQQGEAMARAIGSQGYKHLVEDLESRAKIERKALAQGSALE